MKFQKTWRLVLLALFISMVSCQNKSSETKEGVLSKKDSGLTTLYNSLDSVAYTHQETSGKYSAYNDIMHYMFKLRYMTNPEISVQSQWKKLSDYIDSCSNLQADSIVLQCQIRADLRRQIDSIVKPTNK